MSLEDSLRLLTLPRVVGTDPADGAEIVAQNGRYGPYLKKGTDSRSLDNAELLFSIGLQEALELFAQPKSRRGRGSVEPLRELGADPATGKPMLLKEGRFGPYVTDGETNASLRKQDTVDGLTVERAAELLADRRAAGPPAKRGRGGFKKAAAKKAPAKKAAEPKKGGQEDGGQEGGGQEGAGEKGGGEKGGGQEGRRGVQGSGSRHQGGGTEDHGDGRVGHGGQEGGRGEAWVATGGGRGEPAMRSPKATSE